MARSTSRYGIIQVASQFFEELKTTVYLSWGFPGGSDVKTLPAIQETQIQSLDGEDPLERGMATHFSILAWRIPWTGELGRLQSLVS